MISKDKTARAHILRMLNLCYPDELGINVIITGLAQVGLEFSEAEVRGHIVYLADKGYVRYREIKDPDSGLNILMVRLSAKGKDYHDGLLESDPGIGV